MEEKEFYRGEILKVVENINSTAFLRYIYIIIKDILKK
jgi:hypothetical protein